MAYVMIDPILHCADVDVTLTFHILAKLISNALCCWSL